MANGLCYLLLLPIIIFGVGFLIDWINSFDIG